jgi:hypothetical protein
MGVPSSSFVDTYNGKVTDLMVKLVEYVQDMDKFLNTPATNGGTGTGTGTGPDNTPINMIQQPSILEKNENGYPILPDPIPSEGWKKTTWDSLFTDYLGQQYHLACGGITKHIPYKRISEKQKDFIENKYLPPKTQFRSPRNIAIQEMKSIFNHLLQRQRTYGTEDTFKFKSIKLKGETLPAKYKIDLDEENPSGNDPEPNLETTANRSTPRGPIGTTDFTPAGPSSTTPAGPAGPTNSSPAGPIVAGPVDSGLINSSPTPITNVDSTIVQDPVSGGTQPQNGMNSKTLRPRPRPRPITKKKN